MAGSGGGAGSSATAAAASMRIIGVEGAIVLIEGMLKAGVASESIIMIFVRCGIGMDRQRENAGKGPQARYNNNNNNNYTQPRQLDQA